MADFAPPTGPPPPHVPQGWKAVYNDQYKEWFYVNLYTKVSQWDKPTEPVYPPGEGPPGGPPPGYDSAGARPMTGEKTGGTGAAMFGSGAGGHNLSADEEYARKLQAEEDARSHGGPAATGQRTGAADGYYSQQPGAQQYGGPQQQYGSGAAVYGQPQEQHTSSSKGGLLGKLLGKGKSSSSGYGGQQGYGQPQGYPQQQYMQPGRRPGGGMGMAGGAALGAGGGLLGGMLLSNAMDGGDHGGYGGDDGGYGGDDGGGYGGDGGGDFGGGDFGGGDGGGGDGGGGD